MSKDFTKATLSELVASAHRLGMEVHIQLSRRDSAPGEAMKRSKSKKKAKKKAAKSMKMPMKMPKGMKGMGY